MLHSFPAVPTARSSSTVGTGLLQLVLWVGGYGCKLAIQQPVLLETPEGVHSLQVVVLSDPLPFRG